MFFFSEKQNPLTGNVISSSLRKSIIPHPLSFQSSIHIRITTHKKLGCREHINFRFTY